MQNVIVLGCDGYIGYPLCIRLLKKGFNVVGVDDLSKRFNSAMELEVKSLVPYLPLQEKINLLKSIGNYEFEKMDIAGEYDKLYNLIAAVNPNTIINLAHIPSAPFSHKNNTLSNYTLINNIIGMNNLLWIMKEFKDIHLVNLGTTGEYQHTANLDIAEGYACIEYKGRTSEEIIFPRRPGSIYHASKVCNTYLADIMTKACGLKITDIMQAIVTGLYTDDLNPSTINDGLPLNTTFFIDDVYGTVVNRFISQALMNQPLTIFGEGKHQRGFLTLNDSIQALEIAVDNPPTDTSKPRVWNQLAEWHSILTIAEKVKEQTKKILNKNIEFQFIESPRSEFTGEFYYNYECNILNSLGFKQSRTLDNEIEYCLKLFSDFYNEKDLVKFQKYIMPTVTWS